MPGRDKPGGGWWNMVEGSGMQHNATKVWTGLKWALVAWQNALKCFEMVWIEAAL